MPDMFYLDAFDSNKANTGGFHGAQPIEFWTKWLGRVLPRETILPSDRGSRFRGNLKSNLAHILSGLEMKFGLILAQEETSKSILYETYRRMLVFESCVATYSVVEGFGSAFHLSNLTEQGLLKKKVRRVEWMDALKQAKLFDWSAFEGDLRIIKNCRDTMHQNHLSSRPRIDFHAHDVNVEFRAVQRTLEKVLRADTKNVHRILGSTKLLP